MIPGKEPTPSVAPPNRPRFTRPHGWDPTGVTFGPGEHRCSAPMLEFWGLSRRPDMKGLAHEGPGSKSWTSSRQSVVATVAPDTGAPKVEFSH
jgi:hypothetical protein